MGIKWCPSLRSSTNGYSTCTTAISTNVSRSLSLSLCCMCKCMSEFIFLCLYVRCNGGMARRVDSIELPWGIYIYRERWAWNENTIYSNGHLRYIETVTGVWKSYFIRVFQNKDFFTKKRISKYYRAGNTPPKYRIMLISRTVIFYHLRISSRSKIQYQTHIFYNIYFNGYCKVLNVYLKCQKNIYSFCPKLI